MATCNHMQDARNERRILLVSIKATVEGLLASYSSNVWNTYGGLTRLCNDVERILCHHLKTSEGVYDYWQFLLGLRVLQPTLAPALQRHRVMLESQGAKCLGRSWILQSLEDHTLSTQLRLLLKDRNHLKTCYHDSSFLCREECVEAFLLCLDAVDQNRLILLAELNPALLVNLQTHGVHSTRRSASLTFNTANNYTPMQCEWHSKLSWPAIHQSPSLPGRSQPCCCWSSLHSEFQFTDPVAGLAKACLLCCSEQKNNLLYSSSRESVSSYGSVAPDLHSAQRNSERDLSSSKARNRAISDNFEKKLNVIYSSRCDPLCSSVPRSYTDSQLYSNSTIVPCWQNTQLPIDNLASTSVEDYSYVTEGTVNLRWSQGLPDVIADAKITENSFKTQSEQLGHMEELCEDQQVTSEFLDELEPELCENSRLVLTDNGQKCQTFTKKSKSEELLSNRYEIETMFNGAFDFLSNRCSSDSRVPTDLDSDFATKLDLRSKDVHCVEPTVKRDNEIDSLRRTLVACDKFSKVFDAGGRKSRRHSESDVNYVQRLLDDTEMISTSSTPSPPHLMSLLKVDYMVDAFINSSVSDAESSKARVRRRRHSTKGKHADRRGSDTVSVSTLCPADDSLELEECASLTSKTATCSPELQQKTPVSDQTDGIYKKSGNSSTPRRWSHQRSRSDMTYLITKESSFPSAASDYGIAGTESAAKVTASVMVDDGRRKSLLEEGGSSVIPMTECFFPRPMQGQSLTSFLSSQDFHTCAELDKENNHFSISEALIAAIEQIKWNETLKARERRVEDEDESDEEIQHLQQRIRMRRRERQQEKATRKRPVQLLSDGRTDTTTSQSASPFSSPHSSADYSGSTSSDSINELVLSGDELETASQLVALRDNGLSLSMASLYSDADIQRTNPGAPLQRDPASSFSDSVISVMSAESVALSLLKRFSEKQLPKASDLEWLVSEQDAPQRLLPLPTSWPISPDEAGEDCFKESKTRLRGNMEWAPPRAQIIFNIHPVPQRKMVIAKQNYRCAGCGMKIEIGYIKRFRYCEYLGKYFCQCCHSNHMTYIPGRILRKWDFSKYYVSNFSWDLVDKMFFDPLFNVMDINSALYRKARSLEQVRECRQQLFHLKDFVHSCRQSSGLELEFCKYSSYMFTEVHVYSLSDLLQVKSGDIGSRLKTLVNQCIAHINQCQLCLAKGFICEICNNDKEIIFPFQLQRVVQCKLCWACFHKNCYTSTTECPKCQRIEARRRRLAQTEPDSSDYDD